jgi:NADPH-dependent curcumin reductase CurA
VTENQFWRLDARPVGNDFANAFSLAGEAVPVPGAGEVLVRNAWLSMDAGTRMWLTPRTDGYQPPLPLGSKMIGVVLGTVEQSRNKGFQPGDLVRGFGQWADYSVVVPEMAGLAKLEPIADARQWLGPLGMNAMTAYAGLVEVAKVQPSETVLVSAAAGATGSLACQIARNLGARVIGIAGGPGKCRYLIEELGAERAIDYRSQDVTVELAKIEGGMNVYFDNVGGPILDAALMNMAHYGRIVVCGLVSSYDRDEAAPGPAHFDQVLMRRLTVRGFFLPDFLDRAAAFTPVLRRWHEEGRLTMRFDETAGLENVLAAYDRMLSGRNIGKVIVDVRG